MAKRGPAPKSPERRQGHRRSKVIALRGGRAEVAKPPAPPAGLLAWTQKRWEAFWTSDLVEVEKDVDRAAVERLFTYYDEWRRSVSAYRRTRTVAGSKGQPRLNPLAGMIATLEGSITKLESELGLTSLARARLGIAWGQNALTAAEINRMASKGAEDGEQAPGEDPDTIDAEVVEEGWSEG